MAHQHGCTYLHTVELFQRGSLRPLHFPQLCLILLTNAPVIRKQTHTHITSDHLHFCFVQSTASVSMTTMYDFHPSPVTMEACLFLICFNCNAEIQHTEPPAPPSGTITHLILASEALSHSALADAVSSSSFLITISIS